MKIILIIILIILLIYLINTKKYEHFSDSNNIQNDINNILNNIYNADFSILPLIYDKIINIDNNDNIDLTDNLTVTGILNINESNKPTTNNTYLNITNSIEFTNRNEKDIIMDIFPQFFIMIWANNDFIPEGWVICDGKTYYLDKDNKIKDTIEPYTKNISAYAYNNDFTKITTPDLRGAILQNLSRHEYILRQRTSDKSTIKYNLRYGSGINKLSKIPIHGHLLATGYNNNKIANEFGFDFEKSILNSTEKQFDPRMNNRYYSETDAFFGGYKCGYSFGKNCDNVGNAGVHYHTPHYMNAKKIMEWKLEQIFNPFYYGASSNIDIGTYYGASTNPAVGTKEISIDTPGTTSATNSNIFKEEPDPKQTNMDLRPPTYALHYIMKLT